MDIKTVAVIGAGTMGNGIAHAFAQFGFNVLLVDLQQPLLEKALRTIGANLDRQVKKGQLTEQQKSETLSRIRTAEGLDGRSRGRSRD